MKVSLFMKPLGFNGIQYLWDRLSLGLDLADYIAQSCEMII